jgi:hypothetical protein
MYFERRYRWSSPSSSASPLPRRFRRRTRSRLQRDVASRLSMPASGSSAIPGSTSRDHGYANSLWQSRRASSRSSISRLQRLVEDPSSAGNASDRDVRLAPGLNSRAGGSGSPLADRFAKRLRPEVACQPATVGFGRRPTPETPGQGRGGRDSIEGLTVVSQIAIIIS